MYRYLLPGYGRRLPSEIMLHKKKKEVCNMAKKQYEKTTKFHLVFPMKYEPDDKNEWYVSHEILEEVRGILQNAFNDLDKQINLCSHAHRDIKSYYVNNDEDDRESIREETYNILIKFGADPAVFTIETDDSINWDFDGSLAYLLTDNNLLTLRDNESLTGYIKVRKFYPPENSKRGEFFEGFAEIILTLEKIYESNPNTTANKNSYRNRIHQISIRLSEIFQSIQVYVTSIECEYREIPKDHSCIEKDFEE